MSVVVALAAPTVGMPRPGRAAGETDRRESRDRLELLTALIDGPGFDPVFRGDVIAIPGDHAVFPWHCVVLGCRRPRWAKQDLCAVHTAGWRTSRAAGVSKSSFVHTAAPLELGQTLEAVRCRVCPGRPAFNRELGLCHRRKTGVQPYRPVRLVRGAARLTDHHRAGQPSHERNAVVLSDALQLSPQEQQIARLRLNRLADQFTVEGTLHSPQWQAVFQRTWRHPYVPVYYPELGAGPPVSAAEQSQRAHWLAAVYSDESLITKVVHVPSAQGPGYRKFTSSSTLPSLMLTMLEALDVTDGCRVLEIGTGSGYNAALLCERLGSELVTSVDVDPDIVDLSRQRLTTQGYTPTVAAMDGTAGYPPHAPYDRILATCSVPAIPPAWLTQAAPGGIIMTDVRGPLGGTIAKLTLSADGIATGHFLPSYGSFMPLRPAHIPPSPPTPDLVDNPVDSVSDVDPKLLQWDGHIGFIVQWHLPDVVWGPVYAADGDIGMRLAAPDGSGAEAWHTPADNGFLVRQAGPRRLWDRVEEAVTFWEQAGQPNYDRFGVTATGIEQYVWYDNPDSQYRWPLPARGGRR